MGARSACHTVKIGVSQAIGYDCRLSRVAASGLGAHLNKGSACAVRSKVGTTCNAPAV